MPGTGLGLTITRLLTEIQGGELTLDSAPGRGARFQVRLMLPRILRDAPTPALPRRYGYRGPRRRILIVDDNPAHRALLEDALRPLGFALTLAEGAEAALASLDDAPPDLALLDVAMPGVSGWTLAAILRRERGLTAPIVMISAHAEAQAGVDGRVAYHDDYLSKPVNIETLLTRIERHLKLTWLTERPETAPQAGPRIAPSRLDDIERLTGIGHVRGIAAALDAADAEDPDARAFTDAARRLLADIDLDGVAALVAQARRTLETERETG